MTLPAKSESRRRLVVHLQVDVRPMLVAARQMERALGRFGAAIWDAMRGFDIVLEIQDPFDRCPSTARELLAQMRDVVLHEYWTAAGEPERSPGARWVRRRRPQQTSLPDRDHPPLSVAPRARSTR